MDTIVSLLKRFYPAKCVETLVVDWDVLNAECLKIVASKTLGYAIIFASVLVKLPQVIKMMGARSGKGISLSSVILELAAISATVAYSVAKSFPFSAWGEGLFLCLQTAAVGFLTLFYETSSSSAISFGVGYSAIMVALLGGFAPLHLITTLQALNIPIVVVSKFLQISTNYRSSSTGQLSAITVGLLFLGCVVRIATSWIETGDMLTVVNYVVSTLLNGTILGQILYYGGGGGGGRSTDAKVKSS
jgi:mannose-P-dolichol utilization defect protein 1